jgi:hypothetical protein
VPQLLVRPGDQVGQPGLLGALAQRDRQRVALAGVAVPADLEPRLLALMPAQQHPAAVGMHDQRGGCDVQRDRAQPRVIGAGRQCADPLDVGGLSLILRTVAGEHVRDGTTGTGHR